MLYKHTQSVQSIQTLKRSDLAKTVQIETGLSASQSSEMVKQTFKIISDTLGHGEDVKLANFGTFKLRDTVQRIARNPKTNAEVLIKPSRVVTFKPSSIMKERTNSALTANRKDCEPSSITQTFKIKPLIK